ncbi:MAG: glycosyltransferase family 4 protein [Symploca sp. SIO2E9]|nr:glycosyltransferase family 4 protein [Symploca sp. SIO2E9]
MWQLKPQTQSSGFENLVQVDRYNPQVASRELEEQGNQGENIYPSTLSNSALAGNLNNTVLIKETKTQQSQQESQRWIKFVFVGRLVNWKAVDLLLLAFKQVVEQIPVELEIIGKGPEQVVFEAQAKELGLTKFHNQDSGSTIEDREVVRFTGWLSQAECAQRLQLADVMVLPSLFECGGAVVLEAMAMGIPVIATNWGGPADYLDQSCGILVEPASRNAFINDLAAAMLKMAKSPQLRQAMGKAAHQRVLDHFDWEVKVDKMIEIYQETIKCSN